MTTVKNVSINRYGPLTLLEQDEIIVALQAKKLVQVLTLEQAVWVVGIYMANAGVEERLVIIRTGTGFMIDPKEQGKVIFGNAE